MSMSLMVLAMKARVGNPLRKLVLIKLADNASDSGECWPAVSTIAEHCEISERSVQNHIKQLVIDGFVRVEKRRGENGVSKSNIYHLQLKWEGANPAPYKKPSKTEGANPAPYGANAAGGGCKSCGGEGANPAPRTSQLEPVNEPNTPPTPSGRGTTKPKFDPLAVELPVWLQQSVWQEWVEYRRALQKPIKTQQGVTGLIRKLEEYRRQGFSPEQVIQHSMACEYRGLFAPASVQATRTTNVNFVSEPDKVIPSGFRGSFVAGN